MLYHGRTMADAFCILGLPSTFRARSFNTGLLRAAQDVAPDGVSVEIFPIQTLPFYDQDLDGSDDEPGPVREFRERVRVADALLVSCAEYSHSITGVLKNALDWASRPLPNHPLKFKSVALVSATGGASRGNSIKARHSASAGIDRDVSDDAPGAHDWRCSREV